MGNDERGLFQCGVGVLQAGDDKSATVGKKKKKKRLNQMVRGEPSGLFSSSVESLV